MKAKNVLKLIGASESIATEWKQSLSEIDEIIEAAAAFANTEGGQIFVGVFPEGKVSGVQIGKGTIEKMVNQIAQNTDPKLHPKVITKKIDGKEVIVVEVKESQDHLVLAFGRPYKRVGRSTVKMTKDEYERLILEKHKESHYFDMEVCKGALLSDIDVSKIKHFLSFARKERGLDIDESGSLKNILMWLKLLKSGKPTNSAVLLFGKDPTKFFEQSEVKCIRFKGVDVAGEMMDLKPINGDAISLLKEAEKFIYDHIPMKAWIESGKLERQEKWLYPPKAIREALANAIAHRDYRTTSKVQVRIFDDRIEFWNPGHLPLGWTPETLKQTHESKPVNPSIAKAFFWVRYAEEVGTGTNKIILWCKEWGLPEPEFQCAGSSLVVVLRKSKLTEDYLKGLNLADRQMRALEYLKTNPKITSGKYAKLFTVTDRTARNDLMKLVAKGIVKKAGTGDKNAYYILAEI